MPAATVSLADEPDALGGLAITGAGSWLAQALLAERAAAGLLPKRLRLFASTRRRMILGGRDIEVEALADAPPLTDGPWLILHFAFLGKERLVDFDTASYVAANDTILRATLRIAEPAAGLRFVFASSGAAYDRRHQLIDSPAANPYGWCKVIQERILTDWCAAREVPLVIPRIFNIGGPWVNKQEGYALSAMILAARRDGVIHIGARQPVFRSYVHVEELLKLVFAAALTHTAGPPLLFDTAGREIVEMADLAGEVAACLRPAIIRVTRDAVPAGEADWYVGDGHTYRAMLARVGRQVTSLSRIVADTIDFLAHPLSQGKWNNKFAQEGTETPDHWTA